MDHILINTLIPIFFMILCGYLLQWYLKLDIGVLTKALFYLFTPSLLFTRLYRVTFTLATLVLIVLFTVAVISIMFLLAFPVSWARGYRKSMRAAFAISLMFCNSGNYGLPVVELTFNQNPVATSIQALVLTVQNILTFTLGLFLVARGRSTVRESLNRIVKYPMIYAVGAAFLMRGFGISVWEPLWIPFEKMASALIPLALVTLGAQLAQVRLSRGLFDVILSSLIRLLVGPLIGFGLVHLFSFDTIIAQTLIISTSMPTAVNTALLAVELKNEPTFASQAVMLSTLLSMATVPVVIFVVTTLKVW